MDLVDVYWMSPPSRAWSLRGRANFRSAVSAPVDPARARAEWVQLADALQARGGHVVSLWPRDDELTGLPYAAESGHLFSAPGRAPVFLLASMKPEHRRGEVALWEPALAAMGIATRRVTHLWEGQGDVALFRDRTLLFFGGRTVRAGADETAAIAQEFGGDPLLIQIREPAFHGNMALLPLPAVDRLLVCPEVLVGDSYARLREAFGAERLLEVSHGRIERAALRIPPELDGREQRRSFGD